MEKNVAKLNESQLHDLIKESVKNVLREMDEVSEKGIMPGKFLSLFKNRIINAAHGKIGDVEREVNEFYRYYSRIIQNPKFTIENLMELAEKIEYGESSHGNPGMNRQNFANGWWGGNWGKSLEEIKKVFNMKKSVVKLNENTIRKIVAESVKMVLKEYWTSADSALEKATKEAEAELVQKFIAWAEQHKGERTSPVRKVFFGNETEGDSAEIDGNEFYWYKLVNVPGEWRVEWWQVPGELTNKKGNWVGAFTEYGPGKEMGLKEAILGLYSDYSEEADNTVKLNESQLRSLIKESVKRVLKEMVGTDEISSDMIGRARDKFIQKYGNNFMGQETAGEMDQSLEKDRFNRKLHPKDKKPLAWHQASFNRAYGKRYLEEHPEIIEKAKQLADTIAPGDWEDLEMTDHYEHGYGSVCGYAVVTDDDGKNWEFSCYGDGHYEGGWLELDSIEGINFISPDGIDGEI